MEDKKRSILFLETTGARLAPKRSVTPTTESFANVNRLVTITSVEVFQLIPHLNCVRRDMGESHSHAHS